MILNKVEIYIDNEVKIWLPSDRNLRITVNENQQIKIQVFLEVGNEELLQVPRLDVEDQFLQLQQDDVVDFNNFKKIVSYSSVPKKIFREAFGLSFMRLYVADEDFLLPFEVLATKVTANQVEQMIRYLIVKREHIIRVCLSRTMRTAGIEDNGRSDPEMILSTAEKIINTFLDSQGEIRQHIRTKLISAKVPAWKADQSGSLIDPIDVIFNLDLLRPSDGRQDVVLRGRSYSASAVAVTTLINDSNVEENAILIGGLYSIRRVISALMDDIGSLFEGQQIPPFDREYISFSEVLFRLTGNAMYKRCENVIAYSENLIRALEDNFAIAFVGELRPKITPHVRASRLYRHIFEQYADWYELGAPSIEGARFLIKLRSLSKIFEFFVFFRLFDYFIENKWTVLNSEIGVEYGDLIPNSICFEKNQTKITLSYELKIFSYSHRTRHLDLIKLPYRDYPGNYWIPDYVMRIESPLKDGIRYIILDAKYSNSFHVEKSHMGNLYNKYYQYTMVFDGSRNLVSRNQIVGVFAIFPEDSSYSRRPPSLVNLGFPEFGVEGSKPLMIPMIAGLPISLNSNIFMEKWLDKIINTTFNSITNN